MSRKGQGEEDEYKKATSGACQVMKKKNLLCGWVLDAGKCGKHYKEWKMTLDVSRKSGVFGCWLTQKEAVDKFGEDQLKAIVQSGTIQSRRLATDPRFFEFRAVQERDSTELTGRKGVQVKGGQKLWVAMSWLSTVYWMSILWWPMTLTLKVKQEREIMIWQRL